jgi:hypothetical protein
MFELFTVKRTPHGLSYLQSLQEGPVSYATNIKSTNAQKMTVDLVNSPPHYRYGKFEVIEILEEAVAQAPDPTKGSLQYQVLKYLLRIWGKHNPLQDAKKAQWYLQRLIGKLEEEQAYVNAHTVDNGDGQ